MVNPIEIFKDFPIPIDYGVTKEKETPFLVYRGSGSDNFVADNGVYHKEYSYTLEYYFRAKNEEIEDEIETILDENEIVWGKSGDIYLDENRVFVIYYYI